jgi:hypothetical protein
MKLYALILIHGNIQIIVINYIFDYRESDTFYYIKLLLFLNYSAIQILISSIMYIEKNGCVYILMTDFDKYCPECSQVASINNRDQRT